MAEPLVHQQTATEYFHGLIERALERQQVRSSAETTFYLVNLLARFAAPGSERDASGSQPLGVRLAVALQSGGATQREGLRRVGDDSLFVSGFFGDSLQRKLVDLDYYMMVGGVAYAALARCEEDTRREIFTELARRFSRFVDVLAEVSDQSSISSSGDLLRIYERWLRTGSRRDGERLVKRGLVPNASIGQRFLQ